MADIREATTTQIKHPEVRKYMEKFWESYDKLWEDMDNLSHEEYCERESEMWSWRGKAKEVKGDIFMLSLYGMTRKAIELYGEDSSRYFMNKLENDNTVEVKKINWREEDGYAIKGNVGGKDVFTIYPPDEDDNRYLLVVNMDGNRCVDINSIDDGKSKAHDILKDKAQELQRELNTLIKNK